MAVAGKKGKLMGFAAGVRVVVEPTIIKGACAEGAAVLEAELGVRIVAVAVWMATVNARGLPGSAVSVAPVVCSRLSAHSQTEGANADVELCSHIQSLGWNMGAIGTFDVRQQSIWL